jgi:hypothetical protein
LRLFAAFAADRFPTKEKVAMSPTHSDPDP